MAKRKSSKLEGAFIGIAIVVGGIGWINSKVLDTVGPVVPVVVIALAIVGVVWFKAL